MLNPKKKISKRELKEDKLVTTYAKVRDYYEERKKYATIAIISMIVIVILVVVYVNNRKANNEKASVEMAKVMQLFDTNQLQQAIDGVPEKNIAGLKSIVDNYGGSPSGDIARFYLANAYNRLGRYDDAIDQYESFSPSEQGLIVSRLVGIGACYEAKGDYAKAASSYEKAGTSYSEDVSAAENLSHAARAYGLAGDKERAVELYKRVKKDFPKSAAARDADRFIAQLSV